MIIQRIEIISFGKFKNKTIDFSQGLNIIRGDNESGKSTIISFIYAMLYGFGDNRGKTPSLREKYTPWDGGVCEGKLLVKTDDNQSITIYRKAGNARKYDTLKIYNSTTGEELSILPEEIIGIGSDTFLRTLCIRQLSTPFDGSNDEIAQKLSNIATGGDESINFEKAQKLLESVRREIQPQRGNSGTLAEINRRIADAEKSASAHRSAAVELESLIRIIPEEEKNAATLKAQYEELSKKDYSASIAHLSGRLEEMQRHRENSFSRFIPIVFFTAFILMLFIKAAYSFVFLGLFVISLAYVFIKNKTSANNNIKELTVEKDMLLEEKAIHEKKLSYVKDKLADSEKKLTQMKIREQTLRLSIGEGEDNFDALYRKKQFLEKRLKAVTLASKALSYAYEKMQKNFTPVLNKKASEYFSIICNLKYKRIFCNEQFAVKIDNDIPRESSFFSGGTVDQLYLSLRLALVDMLFCEKSCPLILDQPFLQYDDSRKKNTIQLLESLSKNRQTLLFTGDKNVNSPNKPTQILT